MPSPDYPDVKPSYDLRLRIRPDGLTVLNVGVGSGNSGLAIQLPHLKFKKIVNLDVHRPYIEAARRIKWQAESVEFVLGDIFYFETACYDVVFLFDVLEHLPKWQGIHLIQIPRAILAFIPVETELLPIPKDWDRTGVYPMCQAHQSLWSPNDFWGWKVEVLPHFHKKWGRVFDAMWASRRL